MINLNCDNCDKPFEIDDDAGGEKVSCPYCGDVQRVPPQTVGVVRQAPSAVPGVGTIPKTTAVSQAARQGASEPEKQIAIVRQAMFRAHPFWYMLMVLVFLGGIVLAVLVPNSQQFATARWMMWIGAAMAAIAVFWWLIWWAAPHRWVKLIITNRRTIRQEGIIMRKTSEVLHKHVTNVTIRQTFLQRIFGVGYIGIDSAGQSGEPIDAKDGQVTRQSPIEIEVENVPRPYDVKKIIDQYRG